MRSLLCLKLATLDEGDNSATVIIAGPIEVQKNAMGKPVEGRPEKVMAMHGAVERDNQARCRDYRRKNLIAYCVR